MLEARFPGLAAELDLIRGDKELAGMLDLKRGVAALARWLETSKDPKTPEGLRTVLDLDRGRAIRASRDFRFAPDGADTEWSKTAYSSVDTIGDGWKKNGAYDVVDARVAWDGQGILSLMLATKERAGAGQALQFFVDCSGDSSWDLNVFFIVDDSGKARAFWSPMPSGESHELPAGDSALGMIAEARVDLRLIFPGRKFKPLITVMPGSYVSTAGYFDSGRNIFIPTDQINYTFYLLLKLAEGNSLEPDDTMAAAIALDNAYLFLIGDAVVRTALLKDIVAHVAFYRDVRDWQLKAGLSWKLSRAPLIAQLFWADRYSYCEGEIKRQMDRAKLERLNMDLYTDYVDRVETLEAVRALVLKEDLMAQALAATCARIENWVSVKRIYRASIEFLRHMRAIGFMSKEEAAQIETEYASGKYMIKNRGEERRWDEFWWINYQWRLFNTSGNFRGDCGTTTVVMMALYRAAGIAPLSLQYVDAEPPEIYTHNFPAYYDPDFGRWLSQQKPVAIVAQGTVLAPKDVYLYFQKPVWNFREPVDRYTEAAQPGRILASHYQGDHGSISRIANFLSSGWPMDRFAAVFKSNRTLESGLFLDAETAPEKLVDSDADGLNDSLEKARATDPRAADSDGDGLSDGFEAFVAGSDPKSKTNPDPLAFSQKPFLETTDLLAQQGINPELSRFDIESEELDFFVSVKSGTVFTHNVCGPDGRQIDNLSYEIATGNAVIIHFLPLSSGLYYVNLLYRLKDAWAYAGRFRVVVLRNHVPKPPAQVTTTATCPWYAQDFFAAGLRYLTPDTGKFIMGGPAEFRWEAPEGVRLAIDLVDSGDKVIRGFSWLRCEGRTWTYQLEPPGPGSWRINTFFSTDGGSSFKWCMSQGFESTRASPTFPVEGNITPLAPYPQLYPEFFQHGLGMVSANRGYFRVAQGEAQVSIKVPGGQRLWTNLFSAAGEFIQGFDFVRRDGEIWTITAWPPRSGSWYVVFGISVSDGKGGEKAVYCGRFDFETLKTPVWASGRNFRVTAPYPWYDQAFFEKGVSFATPNRGWIQVSGPAEILEVAMPEGVDLGVSFFTPDGKTVINEQAQAIRRGDRWVVSVNPLKRGEYRLSLFSVMNGAWTWICMLKIVY